MKKKEDKEEKDM
jgi:hypothetical protein